MRRTSQENVCRLAGAACQCRDRYGKMGKKARLDIGTGTAGPMPVESAVNTIVRRALHLRFGMGFEQEAAWWPIDVQEAAGGRAPVRAAALDTRVSVSGLGGWHFGRMMRPLRCQSAPEFLILQT